MSSHKGADSVQSSIRAVSNDESSIENCDRFNMDMSKDSFNFEKKLNSGGRSEYDSIMNIIEKQKYIEDNFSFNFPDYDNDFI
jgi:hypothetical protein